MHLTHEGGRDRKVIIDRRKKTHLTISYLMYIHGPIFLAAVFMVNTFYEILAV
jgi:hypothetical protein